MAGVMDSLHVLDAKEGDLTLTWDPENPEEVENAKKEVERLKKAGYSFYAVVGSPDPVAEGNGTLVVRHVEDPLPPEPEEAPEPSQDTQKRPKAQDTQKKKPRKPAKRKPRKTVAVRPMRGG